MNRPVLPEGLEPTVSASRGPAWAGLLIGPVFFALAAWFLWGPELEQIPRSEIIAIDLSLLSYAPPRAVLGDPPVININGFDRDCMDCHRTFPARDEEPETLLQHSDVVLDHGINNLCRNCHDVKDRNRLVLYGGESIQYSEVVQLCAQCHGPTFRDWQRGAHGRTNGFWDARRGEVKRLICTQCHNPHNPRVPAMDPIVPLPGPNTLRMGRRIAHEAEDSAAGDDPLRAALQRAREHRKTREQRSKTVVGPNAKRKEDHR